MAQPAFPGYSPPYYAASPSPSPRPNYYYDYPQRPATRAHFRHSPRYSSEGNYDYSTRYSNDEKYYYSPRYTSEGTYASPRTFPSPRHSPGPSYATRSSHHQAKGSDETHIDGDGANYTLPKRSRRTPYGSYNAGGSGQADAPRPDQVPSRPSTRRPARPAAATQRPVVTPKATEEDAKRHRIPPGYSLKNWDPTEEPIMLLGSVFDAKSDNHWAYDLGRNPSPKPDHFPPPQREPSGRTARRAAERAGGGPFGRSSGQWTPTPGSPERHQTKHGGLPKSQIWVVGDIDGHKINALPDTGADACFISPDTAARFGQSPTTEKRNITLGSGKTVQAPGSVQVPWKFAGEAETHPLTCWILPGCIHDIILGGQFLKTTQTLSKFYHRIKRSCANLAGKLRVASLNEGAQRVVGSINGHFVWALPDTGSDIMAISARYARELGLGVETEEGDVVEVEFADGSTTFTDGVVRDVVWQVGDSTSLCDFFVVDNLSVDVILSRDYLFDEMFYRKHEEHIRADFCAEWPLGLQNIKLVGSAAADTAQPAESYVAIPDEFTQADIDREWGRRDQNRSLIKAMPRDQRRQAEEDEAERQRQWNDARMRWIQAGGLRASGTAPVTAAAPSHGSAVNFGAPSASPGRKKFLSRVFRSRDKPRPQIPLLPLHQNGSTSSASGSGSG